MLPAKASHCAEPPNMSNDSHPSGHANLPSMDKVVLGLSSWDIHGVGAKSTYPAWLAWPETESFPWTNMAAAGRRHFYVCEILCTRCERYWLCKILLWSLQWVGTKKKLNCLNIWLHSQWIWAPPTTWKPCSLHTDGQPTDRLSHKEIFHRPVSFQ